MKKIKSLKQHIANLFYLNWHFGWEQYDGKPQFGFFYGWYDGPNYAFHLWKFWINIGYYK